VGAAEALQLIDKYGLALVGLVGVTIFAVWLVRLLVRTLERQHTELLARLDRSLAINDRQVEATQALTSAVHKALDSRGELVGLLDTAIDRLDNPRRRGT
jgi:hypothetical protein